MTGVFEKGLHLGLGLLSIGRKWGVNEVPPPNEQDAMAFLNDAYELGVRIFDTAPAYASSETRFGKFLEKLSRPDREQLVVMTKMGEHWDEDRGSSYVDHSLDALKRSVDRSLKLLGRIDLLQLHKATLELIGNRDVEAAIAYAKSCGVKMFGASVSSVDVGGAAAASGMFSAVQFPLNRQSPDFKTLVPTLRSHGVIPIVNRPFAMGGMVTDTQDPDKAALDAFDFIVDSVSQGIVLSGTSKSRNLQSNIVAFSNARGR